ncbi:HTH_Tnp_Tc3_2 domain-containing protein [Trichonephila clavipes]|uniref:HTH_Tnp_Tc3_2 domain-containing protein n=1 Tax=Trichonephila clavipes TaxID=2585209 RepID=A0A8X6S7D9_TRICX|nr:HTH_Tnp_Tc3_2 domain-containing protein [Trichonephila clavipes]
MPRERSRNAYQHVSDFDKSRIVVYRDCGFPCARSGKLPTVHRAGSQRPCITSSRKDRHVTRMVLIDRAATSRALSEEFGTLARQQVSTRTVRRRLQQHGLPAREPCLLYP